MNKEPECPECERLASVSKESNAIGRFLDWLKLDKMYELGMWDMQEQFYPIHPDIEKLLAEYFKIDLNKVEQERRTLLEWIQNQ